jgi:diguanylate cyclase (GGDEF)-like protein
MLVFLIGGATRQAMGTLGDLSGQRSVIPDLISLPGYLIVGVALGGFVILRRKGRGGSLDAVLDAALASLAALALAWAFLITPALDSNTPLSIRLLLVAYPPMSVFLVAMVAQLAFTANSRSGLAFFTFVVALVSFLAGDVVYMLAEIDLTNIPQWAIDVPYALAYLFIGVTVLHPSMRELTMPVAADESTPRSGRLAFVAMALAVPAALSVARVESHTGERIALGVIVLALTGIAIVRFFRALHAHARSEERITYQATHDALTGLPNRMFVLDELDVILGALDEGHGAVAVLFLDLDRFKLVNDSFGHRFGDELLVAAARRLELNVRPGDVVARTGGDEFAVLLRDVADLSDAVSLAERTRLTVQVPFSVRGSEIPTSVSLGVAFTDGSSPVTAEELLRDADIAMYEAKDAGRDTVAVFDDSMRDRARQRLLLERELRHAIEREELHLHYQPIVELPGARVEGFEALIRWNHPTWGAVPPLSFIPAAEESGMISEIGAWVLDEACRQLALWRSDLPDGAALRMAVNLSVRQLRDPGIVDMVDATLRRHGLPGDALYLEITESLLMESPETAAAALHRLRGLGVRLSIDDFGTGYSSLAYLNRFPVNRVKIDRSFVEGLERTDSSEASLVAAIVAMTTALGLSTVAEGVETIAQASHLVELGCSSAQGYLYARPVSPDRIPQVLEDMGIATGRHLSVVPHAELP